MALLRSLGPRLAWRVDVKWHYAAREDDAPKDALPANLIELDGELVLCVDLGGAGVNFWGAVDASGC
jgi:hypothetical protein